MNTWIITIFDNLDETIECLRVKGTNQQVKEFLLELAKGDIVVDYKKWEYGTESTKEIKVDPEGSLRVYGYYKDHTITYMATPDKDPIDLSAKRESFS